MQWPKRDSPERLRMLDDFHMRWLGGLRACNRGRCQQPLREWQWLQPVHPIGDRLSRRERRYRPLAVVLARRHAGGARCRPLVVSTHAGGWHAGRALRLQVCVTNLAYAHGDILDVFRCTQHDFRRVLARLALVASTRRFPAHLRLGALDAAVAAGRRPEQTLGGRPSKDVLRRLL